jgi:hypothetical protein
MFACYKITVISSCRIIQDTVDQNCGQVSCFFIYGAGSGLVRCTVTKKVSSVWPSCCSAHTSQRTECISIRKTTPFLLVEGNNDCVLWKSYGIHKAGYVRMTSHWGSSCNQCCSENPVSVTYCAFVFVATGIQHATRMLHIVFCGLSGCTVFFHIVS